MEKLSEKISRILNQSGKTQPEFAASIGISDRTLRAYLTESTKPSVEAIREMVVCYNINANWLLMDDGPMYRNQLDQPASNGTDVDINILGFQQNNQKKDERVTYTAQQLLDQIDRLQATINALLATNSKLVDKLTST